MEVKNGWGGDSFGWVTEEGGLRHWATPEDQDLLVVQAPRKGGSR